MREVVACHDVPNARYQPRGVCVKPRAAARDRRAKDGRVQHARTLHIGGVARGAGHLLERIRARHALSDYGQPRALLPRLRLELRQLDDPGFLAPLHLHSRGDEAARRGRA
jgi:hypothetical protein